MSIEIDNKIIETNEQGFLSNLDDWTEEIASKLAERDGLELYIDHWELIYYFREYSIVASDHYVVSANTSKNIM